MKKRAGDGQYLLECRFIRHKALNLTRKRKLVHLDHFSRVDILHDLLFKFECRNIKFQVQVQVELVHVSIQSVSCIFNRHRL
jgi:hypothetical protein